MFGVTAWEGPPSPGKSALCSSSAETPVAGGPPRLGSSILTPPRFRRTQPQKSKEPPKAGGPAGVACGAALAGLALAAIDGCQQVIDRAPRLADALPSPAPPHCAALRGPRHRWPAASPRAARATGLPLVGEAPATARRAASKMRPISRPRLS